jgi:transcriptional regulator with XRE-family HTH domain
MCVDIRARLAQNIRSLRAERGWSQEEYADRSGLHRTYVSAIERGRRNPTIDVVERLAGPFDIAAGKLLD